MTLKRPIPLAMVLSLLLLGCPAAGPNSTTDTQGKSVKTGVPKSTASAQAPIKPSLRPVDQGETLTGVGPNPSPAGSGAPGASPTPSVFTTPPPPEGDWFGRVLGTDGKPAAGVTVKGYAVPESGIAAYRGRRLLQAAPLETKTDDQGMFTLKDPGGKPLNIEAIQSDKVKAFQFNVAATAKNVTLQLAETGSITGKITLDGGTGAEGVVVSIPGTPYTVTTGADGTYTLDNLPGATFLVQANKPGIGTISIPNVRVAANAPATIDTKSLSSIVPEITSIKPATGGVGALITIKGNNFAGADVAVLFSGRPASDAKRVDDNTITATVPADAPSGQLVVKVGEKSSEASSFNVLSTFSFPTSNAKKLLVGQEAEYKANALDSSGTPLQLVEGTWSATPEGIITLDQAGKVKAVAPGKVTLKLTNGNAVGQMEIQVDPKLSLVTVAGNGTAGAQDGAAASATFNLPTGLALDNAGNLFVCDNLNNMIRKIVLIGGNVSQVAGSLTPSTADGSGANAGLRFPQGMVYDASNNVLIIADQANYRIRKMTTGGAVTTFAGGGQFIPDPGGHVNATGTDARFYAPYAVALAPNGTLYVADQYNHVIRAVTAAGVVSDFAGDPSKPGNDGGGVADGKGTAAKFNKPAGLAVAADGTVYVADQVNSLIRRITPEGEVSTFAGGGSGFTDGKGASCQFRGPAALVFDKEGDLYVADQANHAIRKIKMPSGEVSTIIGGPPTGDGAPVPGDFADGPDGKLNEPTGLAYDAASNTLYIADSKNNRIRKVVLP